jgi:hypothetical protein
MTMRSRILAGVCTLALAACAERIGAPDEGRSTEGVASPEAQLTVTFAPATHAIQYKQSAYGLRVVVEARGPRPFSTNPDDHTVQINDDTPAAFASFNIEYFYAPPTANGFGQYYLAANLVKPGQHVRPRDRVTLVLKDVDGNVAGTQTMRCVKPKNEYWAAECR